MREAHESHLLQGKFMIQVLEKESAAKIDSRLSTPDENRKTLNRVREAISPDSYKPDALLALFYSIVAITFHAASLAFVYYTYQNSLYYLWPLAWFIAGTSVTSLFVIGHDCAHSSFLKSNKLNDFIGNFFMIAPVYPYFAWKYSHHAHHKYTNLLESDTNTVYYDNAWIPLTVKQYKLLNRLHPTRAAIYKYARLIPPFGALLHNIFTHYFPSKFNETQRKKVIQSYFALAFSVASVFSAIYFLTGDAWLILHLFVIPALLFQFWMSLYTYQHHTAEDMKFYKPEEWDGYKGQVLGTYNSMSPKWLSFLHFNIDVHLPHHVSTAIPSYKLRQAYAELKNSEFAEDIKEGKLDFGYYLHQIKNCHLWDEENKKYVKFP